MTTGVLWKGIGFEDKISTEGIIFLTLTWYKSLFYYTYFKWITFIDYEWHENNLNKNTMLKLETLDGISLSEWDLRHILTKPRNLPESKVVCSNLSLGRIRMILILNILSFFRFKQSYIVYIMYEYDSRYCTMTSLRKIYDR